MRFDLVPRDARLALRRVALRDGEQAREVAVARGRLDQELERPARDVRELGADDGAEPGLPGGGVEARDAVEAVPVGEREGFVPELGRARGEVLGVGRPVQEREGAAAAQLDVVAGHGGSAGWGRPAELGAAPLRHPPELASAHPPAGRHPIPSTRPGRAREGHEGLPKKEPQPRRIKDENQPAPELEFPRARPISLNPRPKNNRLLRARAPASSGYGSSSSSQVTGKAASPPARATRASVRRRRLLRARAQSDGATQTNTAIGTASIR